MTRAKLPGRLFAVFVVIMIGLLAFPPQIASADGKYFPAKAYKVAPAIPAQRAILVYRDGTEKLTIESSLDGRGQQFGWVIPLPSRPTEFKEASPGLIKTLSWAVQPYVTHDLKRDTVFFGTIAVLVTLVCHVAAMTRSPDRTLLLILLTGLVLLFLLVPSLQRAASFGGSSAYTPGVQVHEVQEIGSYELAVLEADNAAALGAWLESNGFAGLTEVDKAIVSDYIRDGWCFVAARLRREKDGYSRPHPLSMSFASKAPVYPMRLTATTGNDVYLELFVISDRQPACKALTLELADTYDRQGRTTRGLSQDDDSSGFVGRAYRQKIGHPDAAEQLWDGCVLSRLCGTLKPQEMNEDIALHLKTHEPRRKHYFSRRGAREKASTFGLVSWCALLAPLTVVFGGARNKQNRYGAFFKRVVVPAFLLSLLTWATTYAVLPKVDVRSLGRGGAPHRIYDLIQRRERMMEAFTVAEEHDHFAGMSKDETARLFEDYYASKGSTNAFTGEPIRHEDSPGNYTVFQDDRGIVWRTYSIEGYPDDCVLTSPPAGVSEKRLDDGKDFARTVDTISANRNRLRLRGSEWVPKRDL